MLDFFQSLMQAVWRASLLFLLTCSPVAAQTQSAGSAATGNLPPNIILITLDTTRADRMGFLGSKRGLTPNLDQLSAHSVVFTRAYAQVPLTSPSHAALLTGTYPQFSQVRDLSEPLRASLPYVPDLLHQHGYHTGAFIGAMILDPASGAAPGFDRGFDVYDSQFHNPAPGESRYSSLERRAEEVANRGMQWLSQNHQGPFFLWLHFFDAHDPYDPPEPFKSKYASAPYDGEIAYADSVVGSVLDILSKHGLFENTVMVVAADHGEAFGEHHEERHGLLLYDETIHVPLLVKLPGEEFGGKRIDSRVALADVAPTLMEAAGIAIPASVQAQSLFPLIKELPAATDEKATAKKNAARDRAIYSETDYAHRTFGWSELHSWRESKYLYVQAPAPELYDQLSDPKAVHNLAPNSKAIAGMLGAQLSDFEKKTSSGDVQQTKLDSAQIDTLHALGYMAADPSTTNPAKAKVNPKDKVGDVNQMQDALFDVEEQRYDEALAKIRVVLKDPDAVNAYLEFGIAMARRERFQDALPLLREAANKIPESVVAHYELSKALVNMGRWQEALPEMRAALALKPDSVRLHFFVASILGHLHQVPEAIQEYENALKADPDDFDTNLTYGRLLMQLGQTDTALARISRAVQVRPDSADAHGFLADAYQRLGQTENAEKERATAESLRRQ